jgi:acyl dehydratase
MPTKSMAELEEMVGRSVTSIEGLEVEPGKVAEFARAITEDNEAFFDEDAAREQGFDSIPAPLTFTRTAYFPRYRPEGVDEVRPFDLGFREGHAVHGEQEYEFHRPVTVGDTLSGTVTLTDVYQREGSRGGQMTFATFEIEYRDQHDDLVITERSTVIETSGIDDEGGDGE